jgi:Acyl-CoA carboxylase epsilon subunit
VTEPPVLRVVAGGELSDEEAAALTAVLTAVVARADPVDKQPRALSRWRQSARPAPMARAGWLDDARRSAQRLQQ